MTCSECNRPILARGLCSLHYQRWTRHGTTENRQGRRPVEDVGLRFLSKIDVRPNGCWWWTGGLNKYGYGKFKVHGRTLGAHRFAWFIANGELPRATTIDHVCHNLDKSCPGGVGCLHRRCVNPAHMEPVSTQENTRRRDVRRDPNELCNKGLHPLSGDNLKLWTSKSGEVKRRCKACQRAYNRERRRLNNAAST